MRGRSRRSWRMGWAVSAMGAAVVFTAPALAGNVPPVVMPENPACDQDEKSFKPGMDYGVPEYDPSGTFVLPGTDKTLTVAENAQGTGIGWTSALAIDKVIVKGGPDAHVYAYDVSGESFDDDVLTPKDAAALTEQHFELSYVEFCYDLEVEVTKTAATSFDRSFDWEIVKKVEKASITTTAAAATLNYTVEVTKGEAADSNAIVRGVITIYNPEYTVEDFHITDDILGRDDETCTVAGGYDGYWMVPAMDTASFDYTCSLPTKADGINRVTVSWSGDKKYDSFEVPFAFGTPSTVKHASVDVTDAFNGAAAGLLKNEDGTPADDITESATFTYERIVDLPVGCTPFANIAGISSADGLSKSATVSSEVCRELPPSVTPPNVQGQQQTQPSAVIAGVPAPKAVLRVDKSGPRTATAGLIVTYTIRVRNVGKGRATSVTLRDLVPNGYSLARRTGGASLAAGRVVWTLGELAPGASRTVRVAFRIDRSVVGRRCNIAVVTSSGLADVRDNACTRVAGVAGVVEPPVAG
jgi:uncharacterized repeat protein (TIGR01451 family)